MTLPCQLPARMPTSCASLSALTGGRIRKVAW
jgi:hypothetical protein